MPHFRLLVCLLTLLAITLPTPGVTAAPAATPPLLRVMSFNLRQDIMLDLHNGWGFRRELLVETIRRVNPDVLGTQECKRGQAEYLKDQLAGYGFVGAGRNDGKTSGEMCGVFYREAALEKLDAGHFWLSKTPEKPGSRSWGTWFTRMATWVKLRHRGTGEVVFVFNTHLDSNSANARLEGARLLRQRIETIAGLHAVVVTGDFNTGEATAPYRALVGPLVGSAVALVDSFRIVNPTRTAEESTHHGFSGKRTGDRIDWILTSGHLTPVAAEINRHADGWRYPSDHFPVAATLRLAAPAVATQAAAPGATTSQGVSVSN